jgi:hypothetical protein
MSNNEIEGDRPMADPLFYDLRLVATNVLHSREDLCEFIELLEAAGTAG